jgi:DNA-binding transcriptional LysR family regulator
VDRSTYPTTLTVEGRRFRETAEEVLRLLYVERSQLRSGRLQGSGAVTISTLHTLSISFFPNWLKLVEEGFGPINARLITDNFHDSVRVFAEGDCDFLLTYHHPRVPVLLDPERFPLLELADDRLIPVSAPEEDGRPRFTFTGDPDRPVPYLAYLPDTFLGRLNGILIADHGAGLNLAHIYENPMAEALKVMAITGRGVAWLPQSSVRAEIAAKTLVVVDPAVTVDMTVRIYRSMDKTRPMVERLWRYLKEKTPAPALA